MKLLFRLTAISSNTKTGPIPVSTTSPDSCPESCPLKKAGCYADHGPLAIHWRNCSMQFADFLKAIAKLPKGQFWRHNQAGDLPGDGVTLDAEAIAQISKANKGRRGFTFTHYQPQTAGNLEAVKAANASGFTVNLSADNLAMADAYAATGAPVAVILPADFTGKTTRTPQGRLVLRCPATWAEAEEKGTTCANCQLCQDCNRKPIIGFPAHGTAKRKASAVANS